MRSFLFGDPGAGGLDLASLNIQRGRDHGLPDYNSLREIYGLDRVSSFWQITSDVQLQNQLAAVYGSVDNIDPWLGGLAEDPLPGAGFGQLLSTVIGSQFQRLRDGDRLYYTSDDLGIYDRGVLNAEIAAVINLDHLTMADVLQANTSVRATGNVFYAPVAENLLVHAVGDTGSEQFRVIVNGDILGSFMATTSWATYDVALLPAAGPRTVQIEFINDLYEPGVFDRNLTVTSIQMGGQTYTTDSPSVFSTATWRPEDDIVAGFGRGNMLNANGYFEFLV